MDNNLLHPELRKTYRRMPNPPFTRTWILSAVQWLQTLTRAKPKSAEGVSIHDEALGEAAVRIYQPSAGRSGGALLWIHGGGYIIGTVAVNDRECTALARDLGLTVISADYRLAPRHPFPAALDDCYAAWELIQHRAAEWQVDPQRVAIAGQSAGGGLAAALAQRIADAGGVQPVAQVLIYPMIDDRTAARTELDDIRHKLWNNASNRRAWGWYLNQAPGAAQAPPYSAPARREDLAGLPPAWIGVGELDLFREEDHDYAERLGAAGVPCQVVTVPGAPHAFELLVPDATLSRDFCAGYQAFLREHVC